MASRTTAHSRPVSDSGHQRLTSLTSRQRRMGPAPLASFEDISMDKTDSSSDEKIIPLPQIGEEPSSNKEILSIPTSPRIRVSAASSPSQHDSKESTPEKEHFTGYKKSEYCDVEMSDLRSSTEELNAQDQELAKKKREWSMMLVELERREEALKVNELIRKGSSSSVFSDSLMPIISGHSSRLSSLGSVGSPIRRSPSPHKMLLETSFCGSKPIQHPSIDIEDPPVTAATMIHHAIEKLENIKSPEEPSFPDALRSTSPEISNESQSALNKLKKEIEESPKPSRPLECSKLKQELTKSLQKRQEQQRRQAEHHDYQHKVVDQEDAFERKMVVNLNYERRNSKEEGLEYRTHSSERQSRLEKRSPRLGKKVPTPIVPELRELPRTLPSSPSNFAQERKYSRTSKSSTPPGSPKSSKKAKRSKDNVLDHTNASRKSSFTSLFKRSDNVRSPITPDSPGSVSTGSGSKSSFSQFLKNAEYKLRSRSRSRSRSKSRDRELEDDTHDRRKKLSIFMPTKKKKVDHEIAEEPEQPIADIKLNDPITSVAFKFNSESPYQPSTFDIISSENVVTRESQEPHNLHNGQHPPFDRDDSLARLSSLMREANRSESITENFSEEVTNSLREKEKEILRQCGKLNDAQEEYETTIIEKKEEKTLSSPKERANVLEVLNDQEPESLSISESERVSEVDYLKKKEKHSSRSESPDAEVKGLVAQDSFDDGELPYVPTTLPQERSVGAPMIPVKEREPMLKMTQSIDRPRSITPIHPSKLEEYKQSSQEILDQELDRMTISIKVPTPGAIKVLPVSKSPRRQDSKSWEDFCSEGLKSPRQLRKQYKDKQMSSEDSTPQTQSIIEDKMKSNISEAPSEAKKWINFDEIPDIVLKPVRHIKIVPPKHKISHSDNPKFSECIDIFSNPEENIVSAAQDSDKDVSVHSSEDSDDEKPTSVSSSEELTTVRETIEELKKQSTEDSFENSDLERLLAPVNECITKLSYLASQSESQTHGRKSPIPDNWEDFLLPPQPGRRSRLSSIGSETGSISGLRSPSPSALLLETSFCGSQPIDDPALAEPNIPIHMARKLSGVSLGDLSPLTPRGERGGSIHSAQYLSQPDRSSNISDSSAESPKGSDYDPSDPQRGQSSYLNPFGMDLEVKSGRSSILSLEQSPPESPYYSTSHPS